MGVIATLQQIKFLLGITQIQTQVNGELIALTGTTATTLSHKNFYDSDKVESVVVASADGLTVYALDIDYTISQNGTYYTTIARTSGSSIASGATVAVSYVYYGENEEDALINELSPIVEQDIISITGNRFGERIVNGSTTANFTASTNKISDVNADFSELQAGDYVLIEGSRRNNGFFTIATASDTELTFVETIANETEGAKVSIYWCLFPNGLRMFLADMIQYRMQFRDVGLSSESISGAVSRSYGDDGGQYPNELVRKLQKQYGMVRYI